jgi:hypothetical protein
LDKLENNRIDLWATGELVGRYFIAKHNQNGFEKVLEFGKTKMYLACNKDIPDQVARQIALAIADENLARSVDRPALNHHANSNYTAKTSATGLSAMPHPYGLTQIMPQ